MGNAERELTHNLCQWGPVMRKQKAEHLSWTQDMRKLFRRIIDQKVCLDAKRTMMVSSVMPPVQALADNYAMLKNQQQRLPWRVHQSKAVMKTRKCCWDNCRGETASAAKRLCSNDTHMHCGECSAYLGKDIFLCNSFVMGVPANCHWHYYIYHLNKESALTMVIN